MARFIREIMNPEVFTLLPETRKEDALNAILELGISAAPVLDEERRPIGVTSLRDLVREGADWISKPALTVSANASIEDAGRQMAESGRHHLIVVGGDGRTLGLVSSFDLMRALLGMPSVFPTTFPHYDTRLGISWTNLSTFDAEHVDGAPDGAGVLVLSTGGARRTEDDLWVESTAAIRQRLVELLELPQGDNPALARILEHRDLRFRCAPTNDEQLQNLVVHRIRDRISHAPLPRAQYTGG